MAAPWWDSDWKDRSGPEYRCFVGNLSYRTDEDSLNAAFASYDPIFCEVVIDRETGRSRGFGFVQFEDRRSLDMAIQGMDGAQLDGRNITVSEANPRPRRWRA